MEIRKYWHNLSGRFGKKDSEPENIPDEEMEEVTTGYTITGRPITEWRRKQSENAPAGIQEELPRREEAEKQHQPLKESGDGLPLRAETAPQEAGKEQPDKDEGRLRAEEAMRERQERELPAEAAEGALQETLQRDDIPVSGKLEISSKEFRQQLVGKAKSVRVFGQPAARVLVNFAAGFAAGAGSRMALSWAVRKGFRHFLDLSAPGMGAAVGATVGASMEAWKAVREERKRLAAEKYDYRQELEGLVGAQRYQKLFELRNKEDVEGLKRSDPQAAEILEKMRRSGISWKKVAKSSLYGAAIGGLGGALGGAVAEYLGWTAKAAEGAPAGARETAKAAKQVALEYWKDAEVSREMQGNVWHTVKEYLNERGVQKPSNALVNEAARIIAAANNVEITGDHATAAAEALHRHIEGGIRDVAMRPGYRLGHFENLNELIKQAGGSPAVEKVVEILEKAPAAEAAQAVSKAAAGRNRDWLAAGLLSIVAAEVSAIGYFGHKIIKYRKNYRQQQKAAAKAGREAVFFPANESISQTAEGGYIPTSAADNREDIVVPPGRFGDNAADFPAGNISPEEMFPQPESRPEPEVREPERQFVQARVLQVPAIKTREAAGENMASGEENFLPQESPAIVPAADSGEIPASRSGEEGWSNEAELETGHDLSETKNQIFQNFEKASDMVMLAEAGFAFPPADIAENWPVFEPGSVSPGIREQARDYYRTLSGKYLSDLVGAGQDEAALRVWEKIGQGAPFPFGPEAAGKEAEQNEAAPEETAGSLGGADGEAGEDQLKAESSGLPPVKLSSGRERSIKEQVNGEANTEGLDLGKYALLTQDRQYGSPVWAAVEAGRLSEEEALDIVGSLVSVKNWKDAAKPKNIAPLVEIFGVLLHKKNSRGKLYPQIDSLVGELKSMGPAMQVAYKRAREEAEG